MNAPPAYPGHRDLGLGEVRRILSFRSLHEIAFAFRFAGLEHTLEVEGGRSARFTLHGPECPARARHLVVCGNDELELAPGTCVEVGREGLRAFPASRPPPEARLTPEEALRQAVLGNTVRAPSGALYVPVNRAWVTMLGRLFEMPEDFAGPLCFIWDASFNSILASRFDPDLALSCLGLLFEQCEPDGFFRQLRVGGRLNNLTNLPVVSHAVMQVYEKTGALNVLEELYPKLLAFNRWLRANRDKNGDGLLEWGWEPGGRGIALLNDYAPAYESGLDDSPMWQDEPVDHASRAMAVSG